MKRLISLLLVLTLCVGMLPAPVWAEEEPTEPTQAVEEMETTEPSEEPTEEETTEPATEPTEEETTEPTEGPTEETTEVTEEETEPTEVQALEEPVGEVEVYDADSTEDVAMLEAGGEVTYYTSLNAAIDAATKEKMGTVTLLKDAILENSEDYDYFNHTNKNTDLTIVLDGHTLTGNMEDGSWDAQLTIDGTKSGSTFSGYIKFYGKRNVLTINGGTYQNDAGDCALEFWGSSTQLNITAGEFKNRFQFSCSWDSENGGYTPLNVTGGTFNGITYDGNETLTLCRKSPYCFTENGQKVQLSDLGLTTDKTLTVEKCTEHTYDENQLDCIYCGQRNPTQAPAGTIATVDGQFYSDILKAIQEADASGMPVVMFADCALPDRFGLQLDGYTVTIDLNGKNLIVQSGSPMQVLSGDVTLMNSQTTGKVTVGGNSGSAIQVQGGSLVVKENVQVEGASYGGYIYPAIDVVAGTVTLHQGATLVNGIQAPDGHTIAEYLAEGSAYAVGGQVINGYVQSDTDTLIVVEHREHNFLLTGKCDCGASTTAVVDAGDIRYYFDDFTAAINEAKKYDGSTVTLLQDVTLDDNTNIRIESGTFTIDWNGHTLSGGYRNYLLVITKTANVTLKDSDGTGGVRSTGGGAVGIYMNSNGSLTILGGTYSPHVWKDRTAYGRVRISGGVFESVSGSGKTCPLYCETGVLADLLAPGYTFAYQDDDALFDVYHVNMPDAYRSVYVVEHTTHELDDGTDTCACGFHCDHKDVGDDGVCAACGNQMAASVTLKGTVTYYRNIADALNALSGEENGLLTLLTDAETVTGDHFTLDLNGKTVGDLQANSSDFRLTDSTGGEGIVKGMSASYLAYFYLPDGLCAVDLDGNGIDMITRTVDEPFHVISSGLTEVSTEKNGEAPYGKQAYPFPLNFQVEGLQANSTVRVSWYEEGEDVILAPAQELTADSTGRFSFDQGETLAGDALGFDGKYVGNIYGMYCRIEIPQEDGTSLYTYITRYRFKITKADFSDAVITLNSADLTFSPDPQTAVGQQQTQTVTSVTLYGNTLVEGTDYEVTGNTGSNAGTYTLTVKAKADSPYYTGDQAVTWEIKPLEISGLGFAPLSKTYDGTAKAELTGVYFIDGTQNIDGVTEGKDYRVLKVGDFASADVHRDDLLTVEVELLGGNYLYNGTNRIEFSASAYIEPAEAPAQGDVTVTVTNGNVATYTVENLDMALSDLTAPCTYGTITYGTPTVEIKDKSYAMTAEPDGKTLKLHVTGTGDTVGQAAVVTVPVRSQNYGDFRLTVYVVAKNKIVPLIKSVGTPGIVYGQKLGESKVVYPQVCEPGSQTSIPGTFRWEEPETVLKAGTHIMKLIFTPRDTSKYAEASTWLTVQVKKRPLTLSGVTVLDRTYDGTVNAQINEKGTFSGVIPGETITYTVTGTFADGNVAWNEKGEVVPKPVMLEAALTGESAENYTLSADSQTETTAVIGCRPVKVTGGISALDRDYAPGKITVQLTKGTVTFYNKIVGDELDVIAEWGTIVPADAGENKPVDYRLQLTGADAGNYALLGVPSVTVTIRPIAQTLAFAAAAVTKTYGDAPFANALNHSAGDGAITYTSSNPAVATVAADGTVTIHGAGTAKITATAGATQNYVETAASFDLTVARAAGTVKNNGYGLTYFYGSNRMPKASDFTAASTGEFHFDWTQDGKPVTPRDAGIYTLTVTVDGDENFGPASLVLTVTIYKTSNIGKAVDSVQSETVFGKNDGLVKLFAPAESCEYRIKGETDYRDIPGDPEGRTMSLTPGTYEFRLKETKNYNPTPPETVTIAAGRKLTVTLPSPQTGYTLTADKAELSWHDSLKLTLTVAEGYYKTASFALKAGDRVLTEENGTFALTGVEKNVVITLTGLEKDEKAPSLSLRHWTFGQGVFQGLASCKEWKNISTATDPYFIISTRGNYFTVDASDGETGLTGVYYLLSNTALTQEALEKAAWEPVPEGSLNQEKPVQEQMIQLGLGEWYFYVKAVDYGGNAAYVGSPKLIREENAPTFTGVADGATYYTTQKVAITDDYALSRYLPPESKNWKDISGTSYDVTLEGNREAAYTMKVEDACQNTSTLTVYMKPISALTEDIQNLTEDNVRKSDLDKLTQAETALEGLDITNATDEEKGIIVNALINIAKLEAVLEEVDRVEAMIAALPDSAEPWDAEAEKNVKAARAAYDSLTDHQKSMVDDSKLTKLEGQLVDYRFTSGENQTWTLGSGKELTFSVNGQLAKVKEVRLNGQAVDVQKAAQAKGTDFILMASYLQGLKPGSYTLQVIFTDGQTPETRLTVTVSPNYLDLSAYPEFGNDEIVTVDGRTYPIGTDGGRYVNLPENGDILQRFTYLDGGYSASHENYPVGMTAYRIHRQEGGATLERIDALDDLLIYAGCSIRVSGKQGIRMITGISEANKKALTSKAGLSGYTLEEYGTLICWNTDVSSGDDFSLDMACARSNYAYKKGKADPVFARQDGRVLYTNVLVGFSLEDCAKDLILRPYIKLKDTATGETVTLYGGSVCRSIGYIAMQNADTYKPGSSGYKYVHNIIDAVYGED